MKTEVLDFMILSLINCYIEFFSTILPNRYKQIATKTCLGTKVDFFVTILS